MTSSYLRQPLRTLEQAIAERLKRPVLVGNIRTPAAMLRTRIPTTPSPATACPRLTVIAGAAEAGDD